MTIVATSHTRRVLLSLLSGTLLLLFLFAAGNARAADPASTLGVFAAPGDPSAVAMFESRVGHPVSTVVDYLPRNTWTEIESPQWWTGVWGGSTYKNRMVYSIPMLPASGTTLASGAAGSYDSHFVTLAQRLVAGGQGSAIIRLGWEFNGNWYAWTIGVPNGPADYAAYWRRVVNAMRSVPGAAFKFDWSAISGSSTVNGARLDAAAAYPGDAYVDYVGLDQYDMSWITQRNDPQARWNYYLTQPNGLNWHKQFAASHGKPMSFPEWGLSSRSDGYGGGDSPEFIQLMHSWISNNNVAYHAYFDYADSASDSRLFNGLFPNASAKFVSLFGGAATVTPPPPPPPPPPASSYDATVLADSPAAYWRLGEASGTAVADARGGSPGNYGGVVALAQPALITGATNTSVLLNGKNTSVTVPNTTALATADTFTLEAWLKRKSTKRAEGLMAKGTGGYQLYFNRRGLLILAKVGSGDIVRSTVSVSGGTPHHVVATKSAGTVRLYIDGVDRTGSVTNRAIVATSSPLTMGIFGGYLSGSLDEVAVYPRALSASDVSRHYAAGR